MVGIQGGKKTNVLLITSSDFLLFFPACIDDGFEVLIPR